MPAIHLELFVSDRQLEQAKECARVWEPASQGNWQECLQAIALHSITRPGLR